MLMMGSLLLERKGHMPDVILSHLALAGAEKAVAFDSALSLSRVLLERESPINSQRLMGKRARSARITTGC